MSIMTKLKAYRQAESHTRTAVTPMTNEQATALNKQIQAENRVNLHANRKDVATPYRVQMVIKGAYEKPQGYFKDKEVASLVGNLVAIERFGDAAIIGHFEESALKNEELHTWLNRDVNKSVKKATADLFDNNLF